ncbi:uncharacterized protein PAC_09265 [Phialocephala subalpina]|uniref:Uncharacterized protein n=1 Tax=Phialocephala subalpina TaxID=576137 RepID=A0A1L7X2Y3_9HELO|nr:uncharacterized protein PAC_09265 [Phialocephala subalpina]
MAPLTMRQYAFLQDDQRPHFKQPVLEAIQIFLRAYPSLDAPTVKDTQPTPGQLHGSIILPLWEQIPTFNTNSPHWTAFNTFLDTLAIAIFHAASALKANMPEENLSFQAIPDRLGSFFNCFETCRLSANESLEPHTLESNHPTQMAVIKWFGYFTCGGKWVDPVIRGTTTIEAGSAMVIRAGSLYSTTKFEGTERYQVELFSPDLELPTRPHLMDGEELDGDEETSEVTKEETEKGEKGGTKEEIKDEAQEDKSEGVEQEVLPKDVEVVGDIVYLDWREERSDDEGGDEEDAIQTQSVQKDDPKVLEKSEEIGEEKKEGKSEEKGEETKEATSKLLTKLQELLNL